jgi:hypothetical protein
LSGVERKQIPKNKKTMAPSQALNGFLLDLIFVILKILILEKPVTA